MLGGRLKAALGGGRRGPVLPLSGHHVVHSGSFGLERPPVSLDMRWPDSCDEEMPAEAYRGSHQGPKGFCERGGSCSDLDRECRASTASTTIPPPGAAGMSPPTTASSSQPGGFTSTSDSSIFQLRSGRSGVADSEAHVGLTQLVISLDLDIMGPKGLLSQLGLSGQHELQTGALRVQCNNMEVHHRDPDMSRTAGSSCSTRAHRPGSAPEKMPFGADLEQAPPQQFFIGDDTLHSPRAAGPQAESALPEEFARLFAASSSSAGGTRNSRGAPGASVSGSCQGARSQETTGKSSGAASPASPILPVAPRRAPLRASASEGSLPETRSAGRFLQEVGVPSNSPAACGSVPEEPSSRSSSPSPRHMSQAPGRQSAPGRRRRPESRSIRTKAAELQELEELRRKNMRLERDLYESLQALEEESISSTSTPTHSRGPSPATSPMGRGRRSVAESLERAVSTCSSFEKVGPPGSRERTPPRSSSTEASSANSVGTACASRPTNPRPTSLPDACAPSHTISRSYDHLAKEVACSSAVAASGSTAEPARASGSTAVPARDTEHARQATGPTFEHGRPAPADAQASLQPLRVFHDSDRLASLFAPSSK